MTSNDRAAAAVLTKSHVIAIIVLALALGGGGLGLGIYAIASCGQGTQGPAGDQGAQGLAGIVGPVISITQPGDKMVISGNVSVRIMLWNSTPCTLEVLINGSSNATELPWIWNTNTTQFGNGWWNLTVRAINTSGYVGQDQVLVFVDNSASHWSAVNETTDTITSASGVWNNLTGMCLNITIARPQYVQLTFTSPAYHTAGYLEVLTQFTLNGTKIGTGGWMRNPDSWDMHTLQHMQLLEPGSYELRIQAAGINGPGTIYFGFGGRGKVFLINTFDL